MNTAYSSHENTRLYRLIRCFAPTCAGSVSDPDTNTRRWLTISAARIAPDIYECVD